MTPPATTACAPSAKSWTSRPTWPRPVPIARARRPRLAAFFAAVRPMRRRLVAVGPAGRDQDRCPPSRSWSPARRVELPELAALKHGIGVGRLRDARRRAACRFPSPKSSPAPSRRTSAAATSAASSASTSPSRSSIARSPNRRWRERGAPRPKRGVGGLQASLRAQSRRASRGRARAAAGGRPLSGVDSGQRGAARTHRAGQLRRRRARHPRTARRVSQQRRGASASGGARRRGASGGDRARIRERMGDPVMRRTLHDRARSARSAGEPACRRGGDRRRPGSSRRRPHARRDELDGADRALHGASAARRGTNRSVCRAPDDGSPTFSALNAGRPSIEMTPESGRRGGRPAGLGAAAARRVSRRRQAAAGGALPLGAARRRARSCPIGTTSARRRCSPTKRRRWPTPRSSPKRIRRRSPT